mmetsp:Transcript_4976/g.6757  ORF Transcript_4976/g.6757 Transcript_4976/m.6757 type:complete len:277 (-) Transcript_4976:301-1131(-)
MILWRAGSLKHQCGLQNVFRPCNSPGQRTGRFRVPLAKMSDVPENSAKTKDSTPNPFWNRKPTPFSEDILGQHSEAPMAPAFRIFNKTEDEDAPKHWPMSSFDESITSSTNTKHPETQKTMVMRNSQSEEHILPEHMVVLGDMVVPLPGYGDYVWEQVVLQQAREKLKGSLNNVEVHHIPKHMMVLGDLVVPLPGYGDYAWEQAVLQEARKKHKGHPRTTEEHPIPKHMMVLGDIVAPLPGYGDYVWEQTVLKQVREKLKGIFPTKKKYTVSEHEN